MANNIMVDLETMGNGPRAAIVAIGACRFDIDGLSSSFYIPISLKSSVHCGGIMDPDTVLWWMQQSDKARAELYGKGSLPLFETLVEFAAYAGENAIIWGNGATFDNVILAEAYKSTGITRPWSYRNDRCFRTIKALYPDVPVPVFEGVEHNALHDAVHQAEHLIEIARAKGVPL